MVKSFIRNPYMSLFNLKLCTHIWSTNINFLDPLTFEFLVSLGLNFHLMGELRGVGWAGDIFFCHGQKRDYLIVAPRRVREARLKNSEVMLKG